MEQQFWQIPGWQTKFFSGRPSGQTFRLPFASMPRSPEKSFSETSFFLWGVSFTKIIYKTLSCISVSCKHKSKHTHTRADKRKTCMYVRTQAHTHTHTHSRSYTKRIATMCITLIGLLGTDYAHTLLRIRSKTLY